MTKIYFRPISRQKPNTCWKDFLSIWSLFIKGQLFDGPYIEQFERKFAEYHSAQHALATGSCRISFYLVIRALNIRDGDEVILPAFNMSAFPKILKLNKIKPIFVDIDRKTLNIDVRKIEKSITCKTKAIVAVHLFGSPCDMDDIVDIARRYNLALIEDCANTIAATYKGKLVGTFGDAACFSFGFSKDIPTFGGGIVLTNNEALYKKIKQIYSEFTFPGKFETFKIFVKNFIVMLATCKGMFSLVTYPFILLTKLVNSDIFGDLFEEKDDMITSIKKRRYMNFQGLIAIDRLNNLPKLQTKRIVNARIYNKLLGNINSIKIPETSFDGNHVYWKYPVWVEDRAQVVREFIKHGIDCRGVQAYDCNNYRIFNEFKRNCPISEEASKKVLTLPVYSDLNEKDIIFISNLLRDYSLRNLNNIGSKK
nr:hypothetical protein [Nanoarchaeum sp.]